MAPRPRLEVNAAEIQRLPRTLLLLRLTAPVVQISKQAPTGIGKTIGTIFPLLKALAPQQLDKVFFLTAKTPRPPR